jgi:hypothetical protein
VHILNIILETQVAGVITDERSNLKDSPSKHSNGSGSDKVLSEIMSAQQQGVGDNNVLDEQQNRDVDNEISVDKSSEER